MAVSEDVDLPESVTQNLQAEAPLGELLAAARIAKKLTQQDVSDHLRFSLKQIDALENNVFSALPDAMITRGFIRNYARLLEIDAEPLLASYRGRMPDKQPNTLAVQSSMREVQLTQDNQPWLKYILGSILILLFLLAWFFYMDYQSKTVTAPAEKTPEVAVEVKPPVEIPLPEIALPAAERQLDESAANITGAEVSPVNAEVVNVAAPPQVDSSVPTEVKSPAAAATTPTTSTPTTQPPVNPLPIKQLQPNATGDLSKKNVSISVTEQTWVSATDKAGKVVFEKMLTAGSAESFDGVPPFNVVIGNANATKLMFSGQSVDLTALTKSNVARVRLE